MDATWMIPAFVMIDTLMERLWGIAPPTPRLFRFKGGQNV
jgi:hypothetical protein